MRFKDICNVQLGVFVWIVMGMPSAYGAFLTDLTVTTTPDPGGGTLYSYTLANRPTSTLNAEALVITVAASSNLQMITGPNGWDISYDPGLTQVVWESSDFMTDLLPGSSASFRIVSNLPPILQPFAVNGFDSTGTLFDFNASQIASPGVAASIPEPISMIPFGTGLVTLAGYCLCCRNHPQ